MKFRYYIFDNETAAVMATNETQLALAFAKDDAYQVIDTFEAKLLIDNLKHDITGEFQ